MSKSQPSVKVKVCGMTNLDDTLQAVKLGADAVGFIFYKKSPRYISDRIVKKITCELPPFVMRVGVFVNESLEQINKKIESCGLNLVQLHGDEPPGFSKKVKCQVIKSFRVKNGDSLAALSRYPVQGYLLDSFKEGQWGGTGKTFNWNLAKKAKKYGSIILAGGLEPSNVQEAIKKVQPYGVDVCSGVEKCPGKKDLKKVQQFIEAVRKVS